MVENHVFEHYPRRAPAPWDAPISALVSYPVKQPLAIEIRLKLITVGINVLVTQAGLNWLANLRILRPKQSTKAQWKPNADRPDHFAETSDCAQKL